MKNVLWFSRHELSNAQLDDLVSLFGPVKVNHINKTVNSAFDLKDEIAAADIIAVVMPIHLQEQTLRLTDDKPVLICRNHRVQKNDGSFAFVHAGWDRLEKIKIVKTMLSDHPKPDGSFR